MSTTTPVSGVSGVQVRLADQARPVASVSDVPGSSPPSRGVSLADSLARLVSDVRLQPAREGRIAPNAEAYGWPSAREVTASPAVHLRGCVIGRAEFGPGRFAVQVHLVQVGAFEEEPDHGDGQESGADRVDVDAFGCEVQVSSTMGVCRPVKIPALLTMMWSRSKLLTAVPSRSSLASGRPLAPDVY